MSGSTDRRSAERSRAGKRPHSERAAAKDREKDRAEDRVSPDRIARVRRFNRFYTRQLGVLRKTYLGSPYSLAEARVLYEIFKGGAPTATDIGRALDLDAGYLSRTLHSFEKRGLIARKASANDARQSHLALTARGRKAFVPLDRRSQHATAEMLGRLSPADEARLIAAMATIEELLDAAPPENSPPQRRYSLRPPRHGDFGWIVRRHAELYAQEYGWVAPFEGVCAQIVADFVNKFDASASAAGSRRWTARMSARSCWRRIRGRRAHPPAAGRSESARARARPPPHRRMHSLCTRRRLPEDDAMDAQRAHRRAPHLSASRIQIDALGAARELGPPGRERALGFGVVGGSSFRGALSSPARGGGGPRKRAGRGKCRVALSKPALSTALLARSPSPVLRAGKVSRC